MTPSLPLVGQPNSTEEPKIPDYLSNLESRVTTLESAADSSGQIVHFKHLQAADIISTGGDTSVIAVNPSYSSISSGTDEFVYTTTATARYLVIVKCEIDWTPTAANQEVYGRLVVGGTALSPTLRVSNKSTGTNARRDHETMIWEAGNSDFNVNSAITAGTEIRFQMAKSLAAIAVTLPIGNGVAMTVLQFPA